MLAELVLVDAEPGDEVHNLRPREHALVVLVQGVEQRRVHLLQSAHFLGGVVRFGVRDPALLHHGRHAAELHIVGQFLFPGVEFGLEAVTARAAVPEDFQHLDAVAGAGGLRGFDLPIPLRRDGGGGAEQGDEQKTADKRCGNTHNVVPT